MWITFDQCLPSISEFGQSATHDHTEQFFKITILHEPLKTLPFASLQKIIILKRLCRGLAKGSRAGG